MSFKRRSLFEAETAQTSTPTGAEAGRGGHKEMDGGREEENMEEIRQIRRDKFRGGLKFIQ